MTAETTTSGARTDAVRALEAEFGELFTRVRRLYLDAAERVVPGLSPSAYKALIVIANRGPLTASALVERMLADKSQVSRLVRELYEHGLIERASDPHDRRSSLLSATELGRARLALAREHDGERLLRVLDKWQIEDIQLLTSLLHTFSHGIPPGSDEDGES